MNSPPPASLQPGGYATPHIRLNSGSGGDLLDTNSSSSRESGTNGARSLTAPARPARPDAPFTNLQSSDSASELLLPPSRSQARRYRDDASPVGSPNDSRRTSWSSAGSRDSRVGPFATPFDDQSRSPSRAGSDEDNLNTQTVSEKYNINPSSGLLLFPEDVEKDDWLHNPDPNERDGKLTLADLCSKRGLVNIGGLSFLTIGIAMLFIGYPILTFARKAINPAGTSCADDPNCLSDKVPLLKNLRTSAIDPDTPSSAQSMTAADGTTLNLVFSDEFNQPDRTFYPDDDPFFQGMNIWYGVTQDLEWYDPDAITTGDGVLEITFDAFANHGLNYRSGMLQSWNQMCFKGGHLEASISLPGNGQTSGFWPGFWAMGNLGRPGYAATTDGMWPYSYSDVCDAGITPNQSDPSGLSWLPGMRLPACSCDGADHPSPGKSRSAPEIDAIEASVEFLEQPNLAGIGSASQSFQVAPFDVFYRPNPEFMEVYDRSVTRSNAYQGGNYQQAISGLTNLNNHWYNNNGYQKYSFQYTPGASGDITWLVGDTPTWKIQGEALGPNGNIGQRVIPEEPMAIIANFGMGSSFAPLNMSGLTPLLPATMRLDYIRIYQDSNGELTCDPVGYPTTDYIANHGAAYNNPNMTSWDDAGYTKPQNSLMDGC